MLVLLTTFCASESISFIPVDTVGAVYDSWVVTFTMYMLPYQQHLGSIRKLVRQYEQAFNYLAHESQALPSTRYLDVVRLLGKETEKFKDDYYDLHESFKGIKVLIVAKSQPTARSSHAILPFVGCLLSTLFGTAKTTDLGKSKQTLSSLASSQTQIKNVARESLLQINKIHESVRENCDVILQLRNATQTFHTEVSEVYQNFQKMMPKYHT